MVSRRASRTAAKISPEDSACASQSRERCFRTAPFWPTSPRRNSTYTRLPSFAGRYKTWRVPASSSSRPMTWRSPDGPTLRLTSQAAGPSRSRLDNGSHHIELPFLADRDSACSHRDGMRHAPWRDVGLVPGLGGLGRTFDLRCDFQLSHSRRTYSTGCHRPDRRAIWPAACGPSCRAHRPGRSARVPVRHLGGFANHSPSGVAARRSIAARRLSR